MSPLLLRRYRADRLLRDEFEALRGRVIGTVQARLLGAGASLDRSDLEAAYAVAWHGLHAAVLEGQQIVNPAGWLAVVTHRRALDEHRARRGAVPVPLLDGQGPGVVAAAAACERDLVDELDDRARLRALLEGLRSRLSERERQAAALCYLQGLSRLEAAAQMGVSESRMRKLMEGAGKGLRGVAAKVGALVQAIAGGEWCEEQGSLMRGLAFGILDPQGDRYRLALSHSDACPACRAYVLSLRGLAAALPPVPALLHTVLAAGAGGGASALAWSGSAGGGAGAGGSAGVTSVQLGSSMGAGTISASGAAGAGAAGGGWWLAGGMGAKLAAGCLLALGVGAGCAALEGSPRRGDGHPHGRSRAGAGLHRSAPAPASGLAAVRAGAWGTTASTPQPMRSASTAKVSAVAGASREFGPERPGRTAAGVTPSGGQPLAASPTGRQPARAAAQSASSVYSAPAPATATQARASASASRASTAGTSTSAAEREFAPG